MFQPSAPPERANAAWSGMSALLPLLALLVVHRGLRLRIAVTRLDGHDGEELRRIDALLLADARRQLRPLQDGIVAVQPGVDLGVAAAVVAGDPNLAGRRHRRDALTGGL